MLQYYQSSTCCRAQVGWLEWKVSGTKYRESFTQWTHGGGWSETDFGSGSVTAGNTDRYEVNYIPNSSGNQWQFWIDGSLKDTESATFTPNSAFIAGEIGNLASQMPGGYTDNSVHEVFSNAGTMINDNWQSFNGSVYNHPV